MREHFVESGCVSLPIVTTTKQLEQRAAGINGLPKRTTCSQFHPFGKPDPLRGACLSGSNPGNIPAPLQDHRHPAVRFPPVRSPDTIVYSNKQLIIRPGYTEL